MDIDRPKKEILTLPTAGSVTEKKLPVLLGNSIMDLNESRSYYSQNVRREYRKSSKQEVEWKNHRILEDITAIRSDDILQVPPQLERRPGSGLSHRPGKSSVVFPSSIESCLQVERRKDFTRNPSCPSWEESANQNFLHEITGNIMIN